MARAITPCHKRHRQPSEHNPHQPSQPHQCDERQRGASVVPVCRRLRLPGRAAMPVSAMTAPGGSITPSKHILGNQGRRRHELQQER